MTNRPLSFDEVNLPAMSVIALKIAAIRDFAS